MPTVIKNPEPKEPEPTNNYKQIRNLSVALIGVVGLIAGVLAFLNQGRQPNFSQLKTYLENEQWQEADLETDRLILKIARQEDSLSSKSIQQFPCKHLKTIDELWMNNSENRFGLTPQKQAYLETGNEFDEYVESNYEAFGNKVSWRIFDSWKRYNDFNFQEIDTVITPAGYLPSPGKKAANRLDLRNHEREMLLSRFDACGF